MITQPLAIVAVLFGIILVALKLVDRFKWAEKMSPVVLVLFLAAVASNTGIIPTDAPVYGSIAGLAVPFAVCLVLFKVNLADILGAGKAMAIAFGIAALGTVVGVVVASVVLDPWIQGILGENSWKIAGPYTGTYIGGSLNFFALWEGLELGDPDLFAAANAVDNITIFPLMATWLLLPSMFGDRFPVADRWSSPAPTKDLEEEKTPSFIPTQIATLSFAALLIMALSTWINTTLIAPHFPQVPTILIVTTLALVFGQFRFINELEGGWELGHLTFYLFFAAVGALINMYSAIILSPVLFVYVTIVMLAHFVVIYGGGRLLKMDVRLLTMASAAAKAGPAVVIALAQTNKGWKQFALPGVLVSLLGYALGNYVGFAVAYLMRAILQGVGTT